VIKKGEPIKNVYNKTSLREFGETLRSAYEPFDAGGFVATVMDDTWDDLELKARMRRISTVMGQFLPYGYTEAIGVLDRAVADCGDMFRIILPDFVEVYGRDAGDWDISIAALERYTIDSSSEFAVRPFIIADEQRMMAQMHEWAQHENEHVRRLASEGCRPALPWAQSLPSFKADPSPVLPILEQLKADPSAYVRKSVANNLNDISKTHPDLVVQLARNWHGVNKHTDWIVKHACRTLLKQGNREVLALFGFCDGETIEVSDFALDSSEVAIGKSLGFSFAIQTSNPTKLRLEYGIDFVKANGKRNRKIFQISESALKAGEQKAHTKQHSFADLSTRKHYPGTHSLTLIANGAERETLDLKLLSAEN